MPYAYPSDSLKKKKAVLKERMHAFKTGNMHAGKKSGPVVTDRRQGIAIALNMAGMSNKKKKSKRR